MISGFTAPGSGTFQGLGAQDPSTLDYSRAVAPAPAGGLVTTYAQAAAHDLDKDLDRVAHKFAPLLSAQDPGARARAAGAVALLNAIAQRYNVATQRGNAWGYTATRLALQGYRVALQKLDEAADLLQAQQNGQAIALAAQGIRYGSINWPGGANSMGVWSWNPNKWGMTQAEADAYDLAQAQLETKLAQAEAATKAADPGLIDSLQAAVATTTKAAASASGLLMFVGVTGAAALAYWMFKDPERGARATGKLAEGGAHAAGTFVQHGAKAAAGAAKLAAL